jgi:hypothetical protein
MLSHPTPSKACHLGTIMEPRGIHDISKRGMISPSVPAVNDLTEVEWIHRCRLSICGCTHLPLAACAGLVLPSHIHILEEVFERQ